MAIWTRQPEPRKGNYFFNGGFKISPAVYAELDEEEILQIQIDLRQHVIENNGVYDKQVYRSDDGRELWVVDQYSRDQFHYVSPKENCYEVFFKHELDLQFS